MPEIRGLAGFCFRIGKECLNRAAQKAPCEWIQSNR
jgi:hypothetical protein